MIIYSNTAVKVVDNFSSSTAISYAISDLKRDMASTLIEKGNTVINIKYDKSLEKEAYRIVVLDDCIDVFAPDDLGVIYGIYYISNTYLGVKPFWFWMDQKFTQVDCIKADNIEISSKPHAVKYRGWFINDETLIHTWKLNGESQGPWNMIFEALLRLEGNLVIPGTDFNSREYRPIAASRGLYITHHHAEPLGAEMFARKYPDLTPSFDQYPDMFRELWKQGIKDQSQMNVVFNLGFRGQGDKPFWADDPAYDTPQSRGKLMSELIMEQYNLVKENVSDAVCCTNLYGETMELFNEGYLKLPDDVIKIWADNGYGKMVSRRQGNNNPRIKALPASPTGAHGLYYHASFYDLQAASHITQLPNSAEFVRSELVNAYALGVKDYWIINCSNVKPHVYILDLIAKLWNDGDCDVNLHRSQFVANYYNNQLPVAEAIKAYSKSALLYGSNLDDHAGDQFYNHVPRILINSFIKDKNKFTKDLLWLTGKKDSLSQQVMFCKNKYIEAKANYDSYYDGCLKVYTDISDNTKQIFTDTILLQAKLYKLWSHAAVYVCSAIEAAYAEDYILSFYNAGKAKNLYSLANQAMRDTEHGKWIDFYANECQVDVKQSAYVCAYLMSYVRNLGDGPHFFEWQRQFLDSEKDSRVRLILNFTNHLTDDELFKVMEQRMGE